MVGDRHALPEQAHAAAQVLGEPFAEHDVAADAFFEVAHKERLACKQVDLGRHRLVEQVGLPEGHDPQGPPLAELASHLEELAPAEAIALRDVGDEPNLSSELKPPPTLNVPVDCSLTFPSKSALFGPTCVALM